MVQFLPLFGQQCTYCLEYYTILYMLLVTCQMMLDAAYFQSIINVPTGLEFAQINLYQLIIIAVHCLQETLQFFYGFDLYKAAVKKSYQRARNWQMIFWCLLAIELSIFVAYIALASIFSIFTYVTGGALLFKIYLLWPLRIFLEEHELCIPLAHAVGHFNHHHRRDHHDDNTNRPGPSGCSTTRLLGARP